MVGAHETTAVFVANIFIHCVRVRSRTSKLGLAVHGTAPYAIGRSELILHTGMV